MIVAGPIAGCLSKRFEARVLATVSQELPAFMDCSFCVFCCCSHLWHVIGCQVGTLIFAGGLVAFGFALENLWVLIAVTFVGSCGIPVFNVRRSSSPLSHVTSDIELRWAAVFRTTVMADTVVWFSAWKVPNARFILSSMVPAYLGIAGLFSERFVPVGRAHYSRSISWTVRYLCVGGFLQMIRSMALPLGIATANLLVQTFYASMTGGQNVEEVRDRLAEHTVHKTDHRPSLVHNFFHCLSFLLCFDPG